MHPCGRGVKAENSGRCPHLWRASAAVPGRHRSRVPDRREKREKRASWIIGPSSRRFEKRSGRLSAKARWRTISRPSPGWRPIASAWRSRRRTDAATRGAFSLQSISKLFTLMLVMSRIGDEIWTRVGKGPSGAPFDALVLLEHEAGVPRNPFINAGALVVARLPALDHLGAGAAAAGRYACSPPAKRSISLSSWRARSAHTNAALLHLMKAHGRIVNEVEPVLDLYCHQCSLAMSCADLARACLPLAAEDFPPLLQESVLTAGQARPGPPLVLRVLHAARDLPRRGRL
ncbi:glutaminase [Benzoatithermus flavus]|uniref:glutaminase n=1 Tax=Benzoatithermus flavus TaxID=3108223 RepID=A0ABU8XWK1_9PROT